MVETVTKLGTWGGVFGRRSKKVKAIAEDLRALVVGLHPDTVEVPRKGDKTVSFGFGEKKMSESYVYLMPHPDRVNLGLWWGAVLDDPNTLMEGAGKKLRHVKIFDQETARSAKVAHLVHTAIEERRAGLAEAAKAKAKRQTVKKTASRKSATQKSAGKQPAKTAIKATSKKPAVAASSKKTAAKKPTTKKKKAG